MSAPATGLLRGRKLFLLLLLLVVGAGAALWEARDMAPTCSLADRLGGASGCAASYTLVGLEALPGTTMAGPPDGGLTIVGTQADAQGRAVFVRFDGWTGQQVARRVLPMDPAPDRMRANADGAEIALFCPAGIACAQDGAHGLIIRAADGVTLRPIAPADVDRFRFDGEPAAGEAGFAAVAVPGTALVAEADPESGTVIVRDTGGAGAVIRFNPANQFPLDEQSFALAPSPSGRFVAAVYADPPAELGTGALILIWDVATRRIVAEIATDPGHRIEPKIVWSRDEQAVFLARNTPVEAGIVIERFVLPERDQATMPRP